MWLKLAYEWRGPLMAPPILFSTVVLWHEYENELLIWLLGGGLFLAGWAVRIWAQCHIGYRIKGQMRFTTSGPYALVRNPIYLGNTLIVLGVVVASEILWMVPFTVLWCMGVYSLVVRFEERRLTSQYGADYLAYQAMVSRWLPRLARPDKATSQRPPFRQALLAELHVPLIILPAVLKALFLTPFLE